MSSDMKSVADLTSTNVGLL